MNIIENKTFDDERALYGSDGIVLKNCRFDGPADGESALKESSNIEADGCFFNLRYPFWHDNNLTVRNSEMTEACRAALWYSRNVTLLGTRLHGIKAVRECRGVTIENCDIVSPEFGWSASGISVKSSAAESEYFLMRAEDISFSNVTFKGKYSFQYIKNAVLENCRLDTKDAFWHAQNVTVKNSVIRGEYLAWYSDGLTLVNCKIIGTQPFCYCKNLKLIDCEMQDADLCFEKSDVTAVLTTPVISIKNPYSGSITVPSVGEIILDDPCAKAEIIIKKNTKSCA